MKQLLSLGGLLVLSLSLCQCTTSKEANTPGYLKGMHSISNLLDQRNNYAKYKKTVIGHFRNVEQMKKGRDIAPRDMVTVQVFQNRTDEFWTYTEIFHTELPKEPIIQYFFKHKRLSRDTFSLETYIIEDIDFERAHINEWEKANHWFADVDFEDLILLEGCRYTVVASQDGFKTLPLPDMCEAGHMEQNIEYVKTRLEFLNDRTVLHVQYFNRLRNKLFETISEGSIYNRLNPNDIAEAYKTNKNS